MEGLPRSRQSLIDMLAGTRRHIDILSPTLEPALFDNEAVASGLSAIIRGNRQARVRIILEGLDPGQFEKHRLMALAKRLPSAVHVRILQEHPEWNRETAVICDSSEGLMVVPEERRSHEFDSRAEASRWLERFERLWRAGDESPEMREFR